MSVSNGISYAFLINVYILTVVLTNIRKESFVMFILICYTMYIVTAAIFLYPWPNNDTEIFAQQLVGKIPFLIAHWGYSS